MGKLEENKEVLKRPKIKAWSALFNTHRSIFAYLDAQLAKNGCSISKFQILLHLYFNGPMTPVQISRKLNVSRANTTTFLKRIMIDDLIVPTLEGGSQKRPAYQLTKQGANYFEKIFPLHIEEVDKVLLPFSKDFLAVLEKIESRVEGLKEN